MLCSLGEVELTRRSSLSSSVNEFLLDIVKESPLNGEAGVGRDEVESAQERAVRKGRNVSDYRTQTERSG